MSGSVCMLADVIMCASYNHMDTHVYTQTWASRHREKSPKTSPKPNQTKRKFCFLESSRCGGHYDTRRSGRGGSVFRFPSYYCLWEPQIAGVAMRDSLLTSTETHCRRIVGQGVDFAWKIPGNCLEGRRRRV